MGIAGWLAFGLLMAAPAPAAQRAETPEAAVEREPVAGLDFSQVTSRARAMKLVREGRLRAILLVPAELSGPDVKENRVYVTPDAARAHAASTAQLAELFRRKRVSWLNIEPIYRGLSFVPSRIRIAGCKGQHGKCTVLPEVRVW